jgi:sialate O-acetylesterase
MIKSPITSLCVLVAALVAGNLRALEVPNIFSDHMVLQQKQSLPVWGRADAGAKVSVTFGQQSVAAIADAEGKWQATLAPEPASTTPAILKVSSGQKTLTFEDVLVSAPASRICR